MSGQVWETNTLGGYTYSGELSTVLRNALQPQTRFVQHCDAEDFTDKGLHVGANFQWNVYGDLGTQGGRLDERAPMPETSFSIAQRSGVIYEFGNSVPYTGVLDDRSAQPIRQIINKSLKNDAVKTFEAEARAQFYLSPLCVVPASGNSTTAIELSTNGTPAQTNNVAMNTTHVKLIADVMLERNIPTYDDGNYRCIGRPSTFRTVKDTLETIAQYTDRGYGYILNGEIGRSYEGIRFFQQTAIASQAWSNAKSDEAYFFGADTVIEGIVVPPEMRGKLPGDFGRDKGVAWYAQEGFALAHTVAVDARIIRWSSVA